ncbi:MAG: hypothetical protein LUC34_00705 [Campylobacter sp.]|nr:hypothetical protein [Campylobacter sp.]
MLDNTIGEMAVINILGGFELLDAPQIGDQSAMKLNELPKFIDAKFSPEELSEPQNKFTVYSLEPRSEQLRDDVITGNTCLTRLIEEYMDGIANI